MNSFVNPIGYSPLRQYLRALSISLPSVLDYNNKDTFLNYCLRFIHTVIPVSHPAGTVLYGKDKLNSDFYHLLARNLQ